MKLEKKDLWTTIGTTVNLGDYNSIRVECGMSTNLLEDESSDDVKAKLIEEVLEFTQTALDVAVEEIRFPQKRF